MKNKSNALSSDSTSNASDTSDAHNVYNFSKLKNNANTKIRYIYHISDIHIRNTQRHNEYREVFSECYDKLKSNIGNNKHKSLIVITGDIMHSKTELSPEAINIAYHFFKNLIQIADVVVIPGNHDCNLSNKSRLDALSPIVEDISKFDNFYYLKKSGFYQYHNIIFGVTSIFDDTLIPANAINHEVWKNISQNRKYKIALYHGAVHGAKTDVGYRMNNNELLASDFDGYDYVLLGDIHKHQFLNNKRTIAYSGSLIQQSYGESLKTHGILKWDLLNGDTEFIDIHNNYGYCTINIVDGGMTQTFIPAKPRIRYKLQNTNQLQYQEIKKNIESKYNVQECLKEMVFNTKNYTHASKIKNMQCTSAYETQQLILQKYLKNQSVDSQNIKSIIELHKKIYKTVFSKTNEKTIDLTHNAKKSQKWNILELCFTNALSYGENNVIDFRKYNFNLIIGILAPNGHGKSAILDIILFCLFDKCSRGGRRDFLNKNKSKLYCSILFSIGNNKYFVERIGKRDKNGINVKIDVNFYLIHNDDTRENLNGIDKNETNTKIAELIGDFNDYLTTCFCLQQGKVNGFMDMTHTKKKEYLNEVLKLNVFEKCHDYAKEKLKYFTNELTIMEKNIGIKHINAINAQMSEISTTISNLQKNHTILTEFYNDYLLAPIPHNNITYNKFAELDEYNLKTESDIINAISSIESKISNKSITNIQKITSTLESAQQELANIENHYALQKVDSNYNDLQNKLKNTVIKLMKLPDKFNDTKKSDLINRKLELESKCKRIDNTINKNNTLNFSEIHLIDQLQIKVSKLRSTLKPVYNDCHNKLSVSLKLHRKLLNNIIKITDVSTHASKSEIQLQLKLLVEFSAHINENINALTECNESPIIELFLKRQNNIMQQYDAQIKKMQFQLKNFDNKVNIQQLFEKSKQVNNDIIMYSLMCFDLHSNNIIQKQIAKIESKIAMLVDIKSKIAIIENLKTEKKLTITQLEIVNNNIIEYDKFVVDRNKNKELNEIITDIQNQLTNLETIKYDYQTNINCVTQIISINKQKLNNYNASTKSYSKYKHHLKLLKIQHLNYITWQQQHNIQQRRQFVLQNYENNLNDISNQINSKQSQLNNIKNELTQYLYARQEFDDKAKLVELYKLYVKTMNYNGLPYEILKSYLPIIENDVNIILHSMTDFDIEFVFYDANKVDEHRDKQLKPNAGVVDINICKNGLKPINVELACGFEKFIIGLAIRITLCQISLLAKPNFLVVDEGWKDLDNENLSKIGPVLNYIKSQYDHVIIISHLEELKSQCDYIINIDKINGHSQIQTHTIAKHIKKPKKIIVV